MRDAFDGPFRPFRNVHKADPLVRLPLTIGLVNALRHLARAVAHLTSPRAQAAGARRVVPALAAGLVVIGAAPALEGTVATRGPLPACPPTGATRGVARSAYGQWRGRCCCRRRASANTPGAAPSMSPAFPDHRAVCRARRRPAHPAGTIRFLDEITRRAQSGRDLRGVGRRAGRRGQICRPAQRPRHRPDRRTARRRDPVGAPGQPRHQPGRGLRETPTRCHRHPGQPRRDLRHHRHGISPADPVAGGVDPRGRGRERGIARAPGECVLAGGPVLFDGDATRATAPPASRPTPSPPATATSAPPADRTLPAC